MYTVPVKSALNVLDAVQPTGRPWELSDAVGIEYERLRQPHARIPLRQLVALYEVASLRTRESTLGLRVGARADPRAFDLMGYIVANSATLGDAFDDAARYLPLWTDGARIDVIRDEGAIHIKWEYLDPGIVECRQDSEMTVLTIAEIARRFAGGVAPREVHFRHAAPRDVGEHRRRFGAFVRFNMPTSGLLFDAAALRAPLTNADGRLRELLVRYADERLGATSAIGDFVHRVRAAIRQAAPTRLEAVARQMGMSARNLERRLNAHGASFRGLRAAVRREMATRYLRETDMSVTQISERLGYASPSELHRAFRAWTGMTPRQFRRSEVPH
jgi:AraC-like DNA-binding protein